LKKETPRYWPGADRFSYSIGGTNLVAETGIRRKPNVQTFEK